MMHRHVLKGCAPTPASSYLKSVGVMRILAEQKESTIRMCWENDRAVLETSMSCDEILRFIMDEYKPTPIITPWSYNKFKKSRRIYDKFDEPRFEPYRATLKVIDDIHGGLSRVLNKKNLAKKDVDNNKPYLSRMYRAKFPDEAVEWLDAVYVIAADKARYAPILGSGGNDGNFDLAENFAKKLDKLLLAKNKNMSQRWLDAALFGNIVQLEPSTTIGHNPDGSGGPNFGTGFVGSALSNPWEFVMMLEGSILFAGSVARRYTAGSDRAVFPFTTDAANVGYATAIDGEEGRGEIWFPLWEHPASYAEIKHVFNEGRVELNGRQARTGIEFARAIASFGTERGISDFQQFCILQRKGRDHLTVNTGRMRVVDEPAVRLISDIDSWYNPIIRQSKRKEASASLKRLVRNMDAAIMRLCKHRDNRYMQEILVLIGRLERYVTDHTDLKPLQKLSSGWLDKCYDGTAEFRLAASVASIKAESGVGSVRYNLENLEQDHYKWVKKVGSPSCVWNEDDNLIRNMSRVLIRRGIDAQIHGASSIPVNSTVHASVQDVMEFLNGHLDLDKIGRLIPPLSLVDTSDYEYPWRNETQTESPIPEAYAVMKLIYPPIVEEIPFNMSALHMLVAGRVDDAYAQATYMLNSHRLQPKRHTTRAGIVRNTTLSDTVRQYLAAALLFPLSTYDTKLLKEQVVVRNELDLDGSRTNTGIF